MEFIILFCLLLSFNWVKFECFLFQAAEVGADKSEGQAKLSVAQTVHAMSMRRKRGLISYFERLGFQVFSHCFSIGLKIVSQSQVYGESLMSL